MDNILVTGGAGYVGYTVVEELSKKYPKAKIIIFDNFSKGKVEGLASLKKKTGNLIVIPWEKADIRDSESIKEALIKYSPDTVIHLAAIVDAFTTNREGKDKECEIVNYKSAVSTAKLAKEFGVKRFIFQSSVSIYSRGEELDEEAPKDPLSVYGRTKVMAEKEILELNDDLFKVVILRPATIVGYNPCFRYETIINLMCIRSVYKIPINIFESAMYNNKTYLDVKDNAIAIIFALENIDKMKGKYFNVTSFHTNLNKVLEILKRVLREDFVYFMTPQKTISQHVYTINSDKIKKIGFTPKGELEPIIKDVINNLKKNRAFFKDLI